MKATGNLFRALIIWSALTVGGLDLRAGKEPLYDGTRIVFAQDHDRFAGGAALFRSRPGFRSRIQSRSRHPRLSASRGARSQMCDGALGHRAGQRPAHQFYTRAAGRGRRWRGENSDLPRKMPQMLPRSNASLIDALGKRYANPQPEDRTPLDRAYADAMREVWIRVSERPRRRRAFRGSDDEFAPMGPMDAGGQAAIPARTKFWPRSMRF